jgi:hypothetical protein
VTAGNPNDWCPDGGCRYEKRGGEIKITENVIKAAAGNNGRGEAVIALLLEKRGDEVKITKDVVKVAARNGEAVMTLFFEKRGDEVKITEMWPRSSRAAKPVNTDTVLLRYDRGKRIVPGPSPNFGV